MIGTSVALPLGVIFSNPTARGPRSFFLRSSFFRGTISGVLSCAALGIAKHPPAITVIKPMAASPTLRYRILWNDGNPAARLPGRLKSSLIFLLSPDLFGEENPMNIHDKAPEFTLQDENGREVSLRDLRGKTVVLYFYPRADTPG